jgi:hypothetical protein
VLAYLAGGERCGELGEADLRKFAIRTTPEFSATFVSMTAAVLLAGRLTSIMLLGECAPERRPMSIFGMRAIDAGDEILSADPSCPHCIRQGRA